MSAITTPKVDLDRFNEQGYLVVDDVLDLDLDIRPVVDEYMALLEGLVATWHASGKLSSTYSDLPFAQRLGKVLYEMGPEGVQPLDIALPFSGVTEQTPIHTGPATFRLLTSPRLLDVVEQFIGPEILSNPIQHVRIKPPEHLLPESLKRSLVGGTDWHQDQGVALPEVDETLMLTVWLPMMDATEENGCLCVVPGSHKGGLATHCPGDGVKRKSMSIPEELRGNNVQPLPVRAGGAVFLHRQTMHAALSNVSAGVRWSFDLRYQPIGQATGRPWFPAFVARSRQRPETEVHDPAAWTQLWHATRTRLATAPPEGKFNRWSGDEAICSA